MSTLEIKKILDRHQREQQALMQQMADPYAGIYAKARDALEMSLPAALRFDLLGLRSMRNAIEQAKPGRALAELASQLPVDPDAHRKHSSALGVSGIMQRQLIEAIDAQRAITATKASDISTQLQALLGQSVQQALRLIDNGAIPEALRADMVGLARVRADAISLALQPEMPAALERQASQIPGEEAPAGSELADEMVDLRATVRELANAIAALKAGGNEALRATWQMWVYALIMQIILMTITPAWDHYVKEALMKPAVVAVAADGTTREALNRIEKQLKQLEMPAEYRVHRRYTARDLVVRFNPKAASPQVGRLPMATLVVVLKDEGDWTQIEFTSGDVTKVGWVFRRYLEKL